MYTVLNAAGDPKIRCGIVVFVRTLAQARTAMQPGESVVGWDRSGHPRSHRRMTSRRTLERVSRHA